MGKSFKQQLEEARRDIELINAINKERLKIKEGTIEEAFVKHANLEAEILKLKEELLEVKQQLSTLRSDRNALIDKNKKLAQQHEINLADLNRCLGYIDRVNEDRNLALEAEVNHKNAMQTHHTVKPTTGPLLCADKPVSNY